MSSTDDMDARHGRMLAELAEAGMGLARSLYAATQNAPVSNHDFALLTQAFHTVSRSVRQTIALELKIRHEPRWPAPAKPEAAPSPPPEPRVRSEQVSWNEYERADWSEALDATLDSGDRDAINAAIETSIARIRRSLGKGETVLAGLADRIASPSAAASPGRTRSALLSTSSPSAPGLRPPRKPDGQRLAGAPQRPPPWRSSG